MQLSLRPIDAAAARAILSWQYTDQLAVYNTDAERIEQSVAELLDVDFGYHAIRDGTGTLVGFCCFGEDARVPGGDYTGIDALDIGLGMRPDLTGQGLGRCFLSAILGFAEEQFGADTFRATIATFNRRSQRLFGRAGFHETQRFHAEHDPSWEFVVMVKPPSAGR